MRNEQRHPKPQRKEKNEVNIYWLITIKYMSSPSLGDKNLKHSCWPMSRLRFSCEETTATRSLSVPALLLELLASFRSRYTTVFLSTVSGPCLDQDLRARTLISAGSLALGFANPFSPRASSFCWCFFFFFFPPAFSRAWIWPKKRRGVSALATQTSWDGADDGPLLSASCQGFTEIREYKSKDLSAAEQTDTYQADLWPFKPWFQVMNT